MYPATTIHSTPCYKRAMPSFAIVLFLLPSPRIKSVSYVLYLLLSICLRVPCVITGQLLNKVPVYLLHTWGLSIYLYVYLPVCQSVYLSIHISVCQSVCLCIHISVFLSVRLFPYLTAYQIYLSVFLFVHLSDHLSIYLSIYLFYLYPTIYIYLFIYPSTFLYSWEMIDR